MIVVPSKREAEKVADAYGLKTVGRAVSKSRGAVNKNLKVQYTVMPLIAYRLHAADAPLDDFETDAMADHRSESQ